MKKLERDLGLYSVITISIGAMIGSGIFVLPAMAFGKAGPAVVLAYLLAGVVVLPAALSKAEMATAMPESGGTYLYVDRGMGPILGTVAGLGTWFSLVFKSSFALVGLGAYLLVFAPQLSTSVQVPVALGLALLLTLVNVFGVKQTGRLQAFLVTAVLIIVAGYAADGLIHIDADLLDPFFDPEKGSSGLLEATGFVFVSYAGVTKIASVAEEVEEPSDNIPTGILLSVIVMMVLYSLVVLVTVGVATPEQLGFDPASGAKGGATLTPIAAAARQFAGEWGVTIVSITAVLALASMANAGILSSSRYPLAMSRDELAPDLFGTISDRFGTPHAAILLTGGLALVLISTVDVIELAKLASAFKICVFSIVNIALIAFRESELDWYEPDFEAPLYPWLQLFGIGGGIVLVFQMGWVAWGGAIGIVAVSLVWFALYGREKVEREGAAVDALRRTTKEMVVDQMRTSIRGEEYTVLVPMGPEIDEERERTLLNIADSLIPREPARIMVVRFDEVPDQTILSATPQETSEDASFEEVSGRLGKSCSVPVEVANVVSHETRRALVNFAQHEHVDLLFANWEESFFRRELPGSDVDWLMKHAPCDLLYVQERGFAGAERISVIADQETYSPLQIKIARAMASALEAELELLYAIRAQSSGSTPQRESAEEYLAGIAEVTETSTSWEIIASDDRAEALLDAIEGTDLVIARESSHHIIRDVVFGHIPDEIAQKAHCTTLLPYEQKTRTHTFLRWILERLIY